MQTVRFKQKGDMKRTVLAYRALCTYDRNFGAMISLAMGLFQLGTCCPGQPLRLCSWCALASG